MIHALAQRFSAITYCFLIMNFKEISARELSVILAKEGDLNIGHLTSMTQYDRLKGRCGPELSSGGCEMVNILIYGVEQINKRSDLLPNITLGFVEADGCTNDMKTLEASTFLLKDNNLCQGSDVNGSYPTTTSEYSSEAKLYDVIAIVGPMSSRESVVTASLMSVFKKPMIGIYATSDDLSDKSRYEYFLRLVASDKYQVFTLLTIAKYFGWTYLSVVYSEGSYGENAAKQIDNLLMGDASSYGICIAVRLKVPSLAKEEDYKNIVDNLIRYENARVVIVFVDDTSAAKKIFNRINRSDGVKTLLWFGADVLGFWEKKSDIMATIPQGAIYVTHPYVDMPGYEDYLKRATPLDFEGNEWILRVWETTYDCTFNNIDNKTNACSKNSALDSVCPTRFLQGDNRIHDAVLIIAETLHQLIAERCPRAFNDKSALKDCVHGEDLLYRIRNSVFHGVLGRISFDTNGDFHENLIIRQFYTRSDGTLSTKTVGSWNNEEQRLYINESEINWKVFNTNVSSNESDRRLESTCSKPCLTNQYIIKQSLPCCWICGDCRENEVILSNRTGCTPCPAFMWPDNETRTICAYIIPDYLSYSNTISIFLMGFSTIVSMCAVFCACVFVAKRQNKLVKALSVNLSLLILLGTLASCITVFIFVIPADAFSGICVIRSVGFHFVTIMIYAPLLVKNIRIYRIFAIGKKSVRAPRFVSSESQLLFVFALYLIQLMLIATSEFVSTSIKSLAMSSPFVKYVELYCYKSTLWFLIPLSYNIIIMFLCACIGFVNRKLPNNFNESWFIFISVATTLFAWTVFIPAYMTVSLVHMQSAILGFALLLNCIVTLLCQYLPILYALTFVPEENVVTFTTFSLHVHTSVNAIGPSVMNSVG